MHRYTPGRWRRAWESVRRTVSPDSHPSPHPESSRSFTPRVLSDTLPWYFQAPWHVPKTRMETAWLFYTYSITPSMWTLDALAADDMVQNASVLWRQFNLYVHFVQQETTLKEQIGVYSTNHVDGITRGRERLACFQSRIAICVESDAVHAIGLVVVVQSRRQLRLFSAPTVAE